MLDESLSDKVFDYTHSCLFLPAKHLKMPSSVIFCICGFHENDVVLPVLCKPKSGGACVLFSLLTDEKDVRDSSYSIATYIQNNSTYDVITLFFHSSHKKGSLECTLHIFFTSLSPL